MIVAASATPLVNRATLNRSAPVVPQSNVEEKSYSSAAEAVVAKPIVADKPLSPVATQDLDYYLSYNNVDHSQEEFDKTVTEGGRMVSLSQGLPEGHYDFSRMTRKELNVALNDIIRNNRAPQSVIDGLAGMLSTMPDTPTNMMKEAKESIKYESSVKNTVVANMLQAALSYMNTEKSLFPPKDNAAMSKAASSYQSVSSHQY